MEKSTGILAFGLVAALSTSMAESVVTFASGRAVVPLPNTYHVTTEGNGLVAAFGETRAHKLEIALGDRHQRLALLR
jgi:hypothetical protein